MGFKGTIGEVKTSPIIEYTKGVNTIEIYVDGNVKNPNGVWICQVNAIIDEEKEEFEASANLIVDAFKVRQQINCELSELKEQRDEMLEMLERLKTHFGLFPNDRIDIQQLIKKVKDNE